VTQAADPDGRPRRARAAVFQIGYTETDRVEALSDGVFAIVVTLLVLDLRLPTPPPDELHLWAALRELVPTFASWAISFAFVLVVWVNHHYLFGQLQHTDRGFMWLNGLLLFAVSFVPFPTGLAGHYFMAPAGLLLVSAAMFVVSASFSAMRWYAGFVADLTLASVSRDARLAALKRSLIGPALYAAAIVCSFAWPLGALIIQIVVPVLFFWRSPNHSSPAHLKA
jgi:TMEM175 potassium channel family protein